MSKNKEYDYNKQFKKAYKGGENTSHDSQDSDAILVKPLEVRVYNNNFERSLRAFRSLVQKERILSIYKEKQTYEKPSVKKRRKRNEMRRKLLEASVEDKANYHDLFVE